MVVRLVRPLHDVTDGVDSTAGGCLSNELNMSTNEPLDHRLELKSA
jgi:hypothetical protein